jgi:Glu-tRNA(Gln) amidotransferase subunit E-like FAD-binding protein
MSKKITNEQLSSIVLREYRKRENKQINEGIIGDLLGKLSSFLQNMTKTVATNTKESTKKTLRATKDAFEASELTKEGMKDIAEAYKRAVVETERAYELQFSDIISKLSKSEDKDIQQNLKGYATNIVMTCMADVAGIVEGKTDVEDLISALQSGNIDTKADANEQAGEADNNSEVTK